MLFENGSLNLFSSSSYSSPRVSFYISNPRDYIKPEFINSVKNILSTNTNDSYITPSTQEITDIINSQLNKVGNLNPQLLYDDLVKAKLSSENDINKPEIIGKLDKILSVFNTGKVITINISEDSLVKNYSSSEDLLSMIFEHESFNPGLSSLIRDRRDKIYELIHNHMLSERHAENKDLDVFIRLISYIIGELKQRAIMIPELKDSLIAPDKFLELLAEEVGYKIPENVRDRNARVLIKNWRRINRRRGTNNSIINLARYTGREGYSLLNKEETVNVGVREMVGEGLLEVEIGVMEDTDIDYIVNTIQYRVPAGVKLTYSTYSNIPGVATEETVSQGFYSELVKSRDITINIDESYYIFRPMDTVFDDILPNLDSNIEKTKSISSSEETWRMEKYNTFTNAEFSRSIHSDINSIDRFEESSNLVEIE